MSEARQDGPAADNPPYNCVLEHYAGADPDEIDLVGLLAYSLYKRQKRDWLVDFRERRQREPSEEEVRALTDGYMTQDLRQTLRDRASDMLNNYAETFVEASSPRIREDALAQDALRRADAIEQAIRKNTGFWSTVWSGIVATGLWTVIVFAFVIAAALFGSDLVSAWRNATGSIGN